MHFSSVARGSCSALGCSVIFHPVGFLKAKMDSFDLSGCQRVLKVVNKCYSGAFSTYLRFYGCLELFNA